MAAGVAGTVDREGHGRTARLMALTLDHDPGFRLPFMVAHISEFAAQVGVVPDTVRYYERVGLLPPPDRSPNGYRTYGEEDVERLRFIRGAQRLGLKLRDIRELLTIRAQGVCPCGHTAELVKNRLGELDRQITSLKNLRKEIVRLSEALPEGSVASEQPWPCDVQFILAGGGELDGSRTMP